VQRRPRLLERVLFCRHLHDQTCDDSLRNQDESDIDCGGDTGCIPCASGKACNSASDCASAICTTDCDGGACMGGVCHAASCSDGRKESDRVGRRLRGYLQSVRLVQELR